MIDFRKVIPVVYQVQFKQVNNLALFIVVDIVFYKVRKRIFKMFFCITTTKMLIVKLLFFSVNTMLSRLL